MARSFQHLRDGLGYSASQLSDGGVRERRGRQLVAFLRGAGRLGFVSIVATLPVLSACAPKLSAGAWQCPADAGADGGPTQPALETDLVTMPWSTGFEDGFCDYSKVAGFCYGNEPYTIATATDPPPRSGRFAAEFKVTQADHQSRCVRRGELPESAYYGAWYYIPEPLTDVDVWNLFHFDRPDSTEGRPPLWDVTLVKGAQPGDWELIVFDPLATAPNSNTYRSADRKPIPFGRWFHIELFLKRATDSTGEIALYQDGALLFEEKNLKSDASKFSQWYVGDFADGATPADSSLYVDDVSIRATLSAAP